ncbi:MAG TPA: hypothetical protein VFJ06_04805 [Halococcus sp.]|nr:hypothetical protein [Halococcus sp.]
MEDTLALFGMCAIGAVVYGVVLAQAKVQSWLGKTRLAAIETELEQSNE